MIGSEQMNPGPLEFGYSGWWWQEMLLEKIAVDAIYNDKKWYNMSDVSWV